MRRLVLLLVALALLAGGVPAGAAPEGQITWAVHTTLVPTYFDPAETIMLVHERAMFAPIYELAFISGIGRRVEESALGLIAGYAFSAPYEDLKLRGK